MSFYLLCVMRFAFYAHKRLEGAEAPVRALPETLLCKLVDDALHFGELSAEAQAQVWRAFLRKAGVPNSDALVPELARRRVNGRQIKNATRTACSLAVARAETLRFNHLVETLDAMEEFTAEFKAMTAA